MAPELHELRDELERGVQALGVALGADQCQALMDYLALLQRWGRVYNLTALREPQGMLRHHLLDSLSAVGPVRRWWTARAVAPHPSAAMPAPRMLDVGSGAGLPGLVFSVAEPGWAVNCVDAVAKKVGFIRQAAAELGLSNLHAQHARVENLPSQPPFDVVTARAFSSLADLCALTRHVLADQGVWVAMKGLVPDAEIKALPSEVEVFHVEPLVVPGLQGQRCLVWMRRLRR